MKIQILDYSINQVATPLFKSYLPSDAQVVAHHINSYASFLPVLEQTDITHVIHSGSALCINEPAPFTDLALNYIRDLTQQNTAQMGICYGHQLICCALVGPHAVQASPNGFEVGWCNVQFLDTNHHIPGLSHTETVWQHHFDEVTELPGGSQLIATAKHTPTQAYINVGKRLLGMQFHPEFDLNSGNAYFLNDRQFIEQQGFSVEEITQGKPSNNHGDALFNYFLNHI